MYTVASDHLIRADVLYFYILGSQHTHIEKINLETGIFFLRRERSQRESKIKIAKTEQVTIATIFLRSWETLKYDTGGNERTPIN